VKGEWNSSEVSVYIHIPFCWSKCPYCDFISVIYETELASAYIEALRRECEERIPEGVVAKTLYIGGGTPTTLSERQLERLFSVLLSRISLTEDAEVSVECNPATVDRDKAELLRALGVNRISLGVQSLNDGRLRFLGRLHDSETALKTYKTLKDTGFENINIDIIYGLPEETKEEWMEDLKRVVSLSPEHISAYALTPEEGTPLHKSITEGVLRMPDEEVTAESILATIRFLTENGYEHYEVSNYAKEGYECRHNLAYWRYTPFLGLGVSAVSFDGRSRRKNTDDIAAYINDTEQSPFEEDTPDVRRRAEECLILSLRLKEGISEETLLEKTGFSFDDFRESMNRLEEDGLIRVLDGRVVPTEKGFLFNDIIGATVELGG